MPILPPTSRTSIWCPKSPLRCHLQEYFLCLWRDNHFFFSLHSHFIQTSIMLLVMAKWSSTGTPLSSLLRQRATLGITVLGSVVYTTRDTHGIHMWGSSEDHEVRGLRTVITPKIGWTQSAAEGDSVLSMAFKCYSSESIALLRRAGCETCGREESILLGNGSF